MKTKTEPKVKEGESCSTCLRRSDKYNGWSNYETWNVALWIDNDERSQNYWHQNAIDALEIGRRDKFEWQTIEEKATCFLATQLKETIGDEAPDLGASMYADLLNAALSSVNWYEIAENLMVGVNS